MECPPHLGLLLCCDINCSSQLYQFQKGKKRYIILRVFILVPVFTAKKNEFLFESMVVVYTDRKKIFEGKYVFRRVLDDFWTSFGQVLDEFWTSLDKYGHVWTSLTSLDVWTTGLGNLVGS